jgi:hypothetical protein
MITPLYDQIIEARPHSFGWLRRSEFDEASSSPGQQRDYYEAWERPDDARTFTRGPTGAVHTYLVARALLPHPSRM